MRQKFLSIIVLILLPYLLLAHGSHGNGILAGFTHPILGIDHNLAILATGILGYLLDQKKWFLAPLAFILAMIFGGLFGVNHEATTLIEKTIAFSVFAIGLLITLHKKLHIVLALTAMVIFGAFHGYAHGAEMSETNTLLKYVSGYTLGASLIALIGSSLGKQIHSQAEKKLIIALVSGIVIGCGLMMLLG